jgi:hypothetical protein
MKELLPGMTALTNYRFPIEKTMTEKDGLEFYEFDVSTLYRLHLR